MRHFTYRGRVVYSRDKHLFSDADILRVLNGVANHKKPAEVEDWFIRIMEKIQKTLLAIALRTLGLERFTDMVYKWIYDTLAYLVRGGWIGEELAWKSRVREVLPDYTKVLP